MEVPQDEKASPIEKQSSSSPESRDPEREEDRDDFYIDPGKEKKLLAKLDLAFTPVIMLAYLSCFLDRSNIGTCSPPPPSQKPNQKFDFMLTRG